MRKRDKARFLGRNEELKKLNKCMSIGDMNLVLIYGRKRVGKTALVLESLRQSWIKNIYYECKEVAELSNVASLANTLSETLNLPPLAFNGIESVLDYIFKMSCEEKMVLVLDEYPYLRKSVKGMDSLLQSLIDKYRDKSHLTLILLGSYIDVMKKLIRHDNPLYGRVKMTLDLKLMDYKDASLFYPSFSPEDKVRLYSVFGGIPHYNRLIDESLSVKDNIISIVTSSGSPLENEIPEYLSSQLSKIPNANEVFMALAKGYTKYSDILSQSHVSSSPTLADTLEKLISMELVRKESPINDENKSKAHYRISDNLAAFYYRYIYRYLSIKAIMNSDAFYERYIKKDFEEQYVPLVFERVCKEYLIRKNINNEISPLLEKIGKYYYDDPKEKKNGEFDIVSLDENGYIFYEVKFSKNQLSKAVIEKEIAQVEATGFAPYKYVFFSRSEEHYESQENIEFIDIKSLYEY